MNRHIEKSNQFVECPIYGTRQISILSSVRPGTLGKPLHRAPHMRSSLGFENEKKTKQICRVPVI